MSTVDEDLDELLHDRFGMARKDLVLALRTLPAQRPWAARLTEGEARLLDAAGFTEDPEDYAQIAADTTGHMARLYSTAFSAAEVAKALGVSDSRVRQRRLAHTLWAINDGGSWVFPAPQFHHTESGKDEFVRGLDQVLPRLLTRELHPTAIAGFLGSPHPQLSIDGRPSSVKQWLLHGEPVDAVLELLDVADWTA
ncbi:DNA-binding protein (plasmid) [Gordonia terrae]|nr:DNA-binding protein [Gordonia terrae]